MKISIVIEGGLVQAVYSHEPPRVDVDVIDLDLQDNEDEAARLQMTADLLEEEAKKPKSGVKQVYP